MYNIRMINENIAQDIAYIGAADNITSSIEESITPQEVSLSNGRTYDPFKILGTKDVATILKCSMETARQTMSREDFPLIKVGKNYKVSEQAFASWLTNTYDNVGSNYLRRGWSS